MMGAVATVHDTNGLFMNWAGEKKGQGFEFHLLAIVFALVVIIKGGGAFLVDHAVYQHQVNNHAYGAWGTDNRAMV